MLSRSSFFAAGAAAGAVLLLSGCGAANSIINSNIPDVNNLLGLNEQTTDVTTGTGRATISGSGTKEVTFNDQNLSQASKLHFAKFTQNLDRTVIVTLPGGTPYPASFTLSNITLNITVRDSDTRSVSVSNNVGGPVTFTQVSGGSHEYKAADTIGYGKFEIKDNFGTLRDIIQNSPSPNIASGKVAFDADDTQLPNGSILTFKMIDGKAEFGL